MESSDLKPNQPDDAVEAWLKRNATLPPMPDDGFADRVLASLPPPPTSSRLSRRTLACLAGALVGSAVAAFKLAASGSGALDLPSIQPEALASLSDPRLHVALAVTAGTLVFAFWQSLRRVVRL